MPNIFKFGLTMSARDCKSTKRFWTAKAGPIFNIFRLLHLKGDGVMKGSMMVDGGMKGSMMEGLKDV